MSTSGSNTSKLATVSVAFAGAGIALWLLMRRLRLQKLAAAKEAKDFLIKNYNLVSNGTVQIITSSKDWELCATKLFQEAEKSKVLGVDCEWVMKGPVALLQIATHSHYCVLLRLCFMDSKDLPQSLRNILADKSILKVGVGVNDDALKLQRDYGLHVNGCVDLRDVLNRIRGVFQCEKTGLQGLAKGVLGVHLPKENRIRCGNWEAKHLKQEQVEYAAMDALVGVDIFMKLVLAKILKEDPNIVPEAAANIPLSDVIRMSLSMCQGIVDTGRSYKPPSFRVKQSKEGQSPGRKKESVDAYSIRKRPLWDNCELLAPDGQLLCTCDTRKARWYIFKGLGVKVSDDPLTVQLNFEPSGRPKSERNYYLHHKENMCVVCGDTENYSRKSIVPHDYRKYFPMLLKEHTSHDVLLMCPACHRRSSDHDGTLRSQLAEEYSAPLNSGDNASVYQDKFLQAVKSAGRALKFSREKIPIARVEQLEKVLMDYYGVAAVTDSIVEEAADLDIKMASENYVVHGKRVVERATEDGGLLKFQTRWRQHFIATMQPKFLPAFWSVDYVPENWDEDDEEKDKNEEEGAEKEEYEDKEEESEDEEDSEDEEEEDDFDQHNSLRASDISALKSNKCNGER